jgi:hypothetical protein
MGLIELLWNAFFFLEADAARIILEARIDALQDMPPFDGIKFRTS